MSIPSNSLLLKMVSSVVTRGKYRRFHPGRHDPSVCYTLRSHPCRVQSTILVTLTHPQTQVAVQSTIKISPNPLHPRCRLTNAPLTTNPHRRPGHVSFPPQTRAMIILPHIRTCMCQGSSPRNAKPPPFRGWKGTNGCTPPNPSSSPLWPERTTTRRRKT